MSGVERHDSGALTQLAVQALPSYARTIVEAPEGEFIVDEVARRRGEGLPHHTIHPPTLRRLRELGLVVTVERRRTANHHWYRVLRVPPHVRARAEEIVADRRRRSKCGCGHTGIRNLGDGQYTCCNDDCDVRVSREEVER